LPSILLSARAAEGKKDAAYAKLLNRPEGQADKCAPRPGARQFACDHSFVLNRKSKEIRDEVICFVRIASLKVRERRSFASHRKNEVVCFV
jgi:hypothetical protein